MENTHEMQKEIDFLKAQLSLKDQRIHSLEELVQFFKNQKFAPTSEKVPLNQLGLFNEAEAVEAESIGDERTTENVVVKTHQRAKKPRVSIPDSLPREDVDYDIAESEKFCPHDNTPLTPMGTEDHEQLDIIPAQVKVIRHRRAKYRCSCCNQYHITASKPKQPIEKGIASAGLLAYIATQKYCDALPLYRQSDIFKRSDIHLDRTNLANWMIRCGTLVQPLINLLREHALERPVIHMDETPLQVLSEPDKTAQSKSYMWLMASFSQDPIVLFHYAPSRRRDVVMQLLNEEVNTLMVDGYEGYQQACNEYQITRLGCMAHARRKFVDAKKLQSKGKTGKADQAIAFIQTLYRIESAIKLLSPEEKYKKRQEEAIPIIDKIDRWLRKSLPSVPPKTKLGEALSYLHNQWPRLIRYADNGHYPIDNNLAENAIRPFTVGRKNWLFSKSQAGAKASANLYSLTETAKANKLNPYEYLRAVFTQLPNAKNVEDVERCLPWDITLNAN